MNAFRISLVLALVALVAPAAIAQNQMQQAPPGTVNYVEGAVALDGQPITTSAVGSAVLQPGQVLSTTNGRAEILLTPGVFLRIGHNSAVQMVTPDLLKTQLRLTDGRASVEVDAIYKQNNIEIAEDGVTTRLEKLGFYEFDASNGLVRTYEGRAEVYPDATRRMKVGSSHELMLDVPQAAGSNVAGVLRVMKVRHFNRKQMEKNDALLEWSSLRSRYLAQANARLAYEYAGYPGFMPGWYWNPWGMGYTWLPGDGIFWNPFGWGFYSPVWMNYNYGYYRGYGGGRWSGASSGRVTAGRNFQGNGRWNSGPRQGIQGEPAGGFHGGASIGGAGIGGGHGIAQAAGGHGR